jgi:oxygen-independent coproporphyrinogen-3 oxidase
MSDYIEALGREMVFRRDFLAGEPVSTSFFGGGTPSVYSPATIQSVIDKARALWDIADTPEISVEVNPDDASAEWLSALAATDVNRISFGVQSFIDRDLQLMGRRHDAAQADTAIRTARAVGFDNISIDLIFGVPDMSLHDWESNIVKALRLGVDHISAYHLTIEPGTPLARLAEEGKLTTVSETESEVQFMAAHRILTSAGFDHYEVSNYARTPNQRSRHNFSYWNDDKYLGLGPSAHSYDGNLLREFAVPSVEDYIKGAGTNTIYDHEVLTKADKYNEFIMLSLRTCNGISRDTIAQKFGTDTLLYFEFRADKLLLSGLLVRTDNKYHIPPEKLMVSDAIIRELFWEGEE